MHMTLDIMLSAELGHEFNGELSVVATRPGQVHMLHAYVSYAAWLRDSLSEATAT